MLKLPVHFILPYLTWVVMGNLQDWSKKLHKQECLPIAQWPPGRDVCSRGGGGLLRGCLLPGGVCSGGSAPRGMVYHVTYPIMQLMLPVCCPSPTETHQQCSCLYTAGWSCDLQGMLGYPPPLLWTEFLTHTSKNITLPQTSFAGGNYENLQDAYPCKIRKGLSCMVD